MGSNNRGRPIWCKSRRVKTNPVQALILMFSRAILAVEYANTLWHVRRYNRCRTPLYISIAINILAVVIYLAVTFRFKQVENSRVYITWYFTSGAEVVATLIISYVWPVMDFSRTHLIKRLTLLTVMMLGDGLINIAKEVVTIVKTPDAWGKPMPKTICFRGCLLRQTNEANGQCRLAYNWTDYCRSCNHLFCFLDLF